MVRRQINAIIAALFLFGSFSSAVPNLDFPSETNSTQGIVNHSGWMKISHSSSSDYEITPVSGLIYSPVGIFDPLSDPVPHGAWGDFDLYSEHASNFFIVQANSLDLHTLSSDLALIGVEVIDYIPDSSLIVELPNIGKINTLEKIVQNPQVRWAGKMPVSWKISPDLSIFATSSSKIVDLDVLFYSEHTNDETLALSTNLRNLANNMESQFRCDSHSCQLRSFDSSLIPIIASDPLVMGIEIGPELHIQNSNASRISNIDTVQSLFSGISLTGAGEVIGVSDTGLDANHIDFEGRLRNPIYNQFGPDSSGADTNSGHGTHVTATLLGGGLGDSNTTGMAPDATFHFYQLEVDNTGTLARWGSLYEMFSHSRLNGASIQTNSWGSESQLGQYTADSRSVDEFVSDHPDFLVLFSAGDMESLGVTPPSTAKNALSVGASTTGSFDSIAPGQTFDASSQGPTLDGRIKPDIVAPGVMICSARAEEAASASGGPCSQSTHSDGITPLYMTENGSSMATPIVSGAAAITRQYLREGQGISAPRSDLIRAILLNGADDLGQPNIPNYAEGWGQLNLSNSLNPVYGDENLTVLFDYERQLFPGHSFIYTFDVSEGGGLDATLTWNDREGSSTTNHSATTLVNDLDLIITSPDGTTYLGNNFVSGFSDQGGSPDRLNNVERIRLPSAQSGVWTVEIGHAGGFLQDFSLVFSANASEIQSFPDLTVVQNSISPSDLSPLQGDTILIQMSWSNQAAASTGQYSIVLEDLTSGTTIVSSTMPSLAGGGIESFSTPHSFSTTGEHILRLRLDTLNQVVELNEAGFVTDNNFYEVTIDVTQIGVRVTALNDDGSIPSTPEDLEQARSKTLDPSTASWVNFPLEFRNEGTSEITVKKSISAVQVIDEFGILNQPIDEWWRNLNDTSDSWTLSPAGQEGDRIYITLNISNQDASITGNSDSIYAIPGTFISDLTLFDKDAPTIVHSVRLSVEVNRVEGIYTVSAGTSDLGAEPGNIAEYSISVLNIGNGPTFYSISCETTNRWVVRVHDGQSSELVIGPILRQEFRTISIKVSVPQSSSEFGAGFKEYIECSIVSVNDPLVMSIEHTLVEVKENRDFEAEIFDSSDNPIGPSALAEPIPVINGDYVISNLTISNYGNVELEFEVKAQSSNNAWPIQVFLSGDQPPIGAISSISLKIPPGENMGVTIRTVVPLAALMGETNKITVRTTLQDDLSVPTVVNATLLEVKEDNTLEIFIDKEFTVAMGTSGLAEIGLHNSGNIPLSIQLTLGTLPSGWNGGFLSGNSFTMEMNKDSIVSVALELSEGIIEPGTLPDKVAVIIDSSSPSGLTETTTVELSVTIVQSVWITLEGQNINLQNLAINEEREIILNVSNFGNMPSGVDLAFTEPVGWEISFSNFDFSELSPGESREVSLFLEPKSNAKDGLIQIQIFANSTVIFGSNSSEVSDSPVNAELMLAVSKERNSESGGLSGLFESMGLPKWSLAFVLILGLSAILFTTIRMRESTSLIRKEEELIPRGSALQSGSHEQRRDIALETSVAGDVVIGGVSDSEIQEAMSSVLPSLPSLEVPEGAAPLPLTGLPDGWTMDQWVAYGHVWWEQNGPK